MPKEQHVDVYKTTDIYRTPTIKSEDPDNYLGQIPKGEYLAYYQRKTDEETVELPYRNSWWVRIDSKTPYGDAWITAVHITEGENDQPVPHVLQAPAYFD